MIDLSHLEAVVSELMAEFEITTPPIPIENMLQRPRLNMWDEVDITQLSSSFLKLSDVYSPRMSLSRMLARHVASSEWGKERNLTPLLSNGDHIHTFARMLIMPKDMILKLTTGARTPTAMSVHFEVPEGDAKLRLDELAQEGVL